MAAITNSLITNNEAEGSNTEGGGGIGNFSRATMTLTSSIVSNNTSASAGGGIHNVSSTLMISNSAISGNAAVNAGGISNGFGTGR